MRARSSGAAGRCGADLTLASAATTLGVLPLAVALDLALGDPPNAFHPVAWLGRMIAPWRPLADRLRPRAAWLAGVALAVVVPSVWVGACLGALALAQRWPLGHLVIAVMLTKCTFAIRGLGQAAWAVEAALRTGDVPLARQRLGALCSRDASRLGPAELRAAAVSSIAENASDSGVAPLFWFACFGLPGALVYRAINTLDAMVGYRGRFEFLGKASARLDDVLNGIPARATALVLLLHGALAGRDARTAWRIARRDARTTPSPNAGWPMATMAGLLGVQLRKPEVYALGDDDTPLGPDSIAIAWRLARRTMLTMAALAWLVVAGRMWA